jgi:hypothetical protein
MCFMLNEKQGTYAKGGSEVGNTEYFRSTKKSSKFNKQVGHEWIIRHLTSSHPAVHSPNTATVRNPCSLHKRFHFSLHIGFFFEYKIVIE